MAGEMRLLQTELPPGADPDLVRSLEAELAKPLPAWRSSNGGYMKSDERWGNER